MKTEIKSKVQKLIKNYNESKRDIVAQIKELQNDTIYSLEYRNEKIKELESDVLKYDALFNKLMKEAIQEEKQVIIGEPGEKPADYQVQISNALKFLELAGKNLTDDQAYNILKPFQADYETMMLFQSVVSGLSENRGILNPFTKTFEKTNQFMALLNSFEIAEKAAANLFDFKNTGLGDVVKNNMFMDAIDNIENLVNKLYVA